MYLVVVVRGAGLGVLGCWHYPEFPVIPIRVALVQRQIIRVRHGGALTLGNMNPNPETPTLAEIVVGEVWR